MTVNDSAQTWVEKLNIYGKSEQTTTTGSQLFNLLTAINKWKNNSITIQGITYTLDDEGYLTMKGTSTGRSYIYLNGKDDKLQLDKGEYIISLGTALPKGVTILIGNYNAEGGYVGNLFSLGEGEEQRVYNLSKQTEYIDGYINIQNAGVTVDYKCRPILNKGNTPKSYEPFTGGESSPNPNYPQPINSVGEKGNINIEITGSNAESQSLDISTPNGLNGIKVSSGGNYTDSTGQQWITDEIDFDRGVYIQRIFTKTFNGSENWQSDTQGVRFRYWASMNKSVRVSDTSSVLSMNTNFPLGGRGGTSSHNNVYTIAVMMGTPSILVSLNGTETLKEFKTYLSQHPMTVMTVLQKPVEKALSSSDIQTYKALHTNYPTTIINNDSNAEMKLDYVANTKKYIDDTILEWK